MPLYSYKMTHDSGCAPNPFGGIMTLAICKPKIRENCTIGEYVAGFTSDTLFRNYNLNNRNGLKYLIYIMRVTEKLTFEEYFDDPRFQFKKPTNQNQRTKAGDNIYQPSSNTKFIQLNNWCHHCRADQKRDLSGKYVLISDDFYYFGSSAINVLEKFRIEVPNVQSSYGAKTEDFEDLLNHLANKYPDQKNTLIGNPHSWGFRLY